MQELCIMAAVKKLYLEEMQSCANRNGLKGWEVPIDLILEPEVFTEKNGLLTSALKLCRPNLEKKYRSLLEGLYNHSSCAERWDTCNWNHNVVHWGRFTLGHIVLGQVHTGPYCIGAGSHWAILYWGRFTLGHIVLGHVPYPCLLQV